MTASKSPAMIRKKIKTESKMLTLSARFSTRRSVVVPLSSERRNTFLVKKTPIGLSSRLQSGFRTNARIPPAMKGARMDSSRPNQLPAATERSIRNPSRIHPVRITAQKTKIVSCFRNVRFFIAPSVQK